MLFTSYHRELSMWQTESFTYLFASHTVAELQWRWIRKKLQTLPCSTMTSAHPARPHLHIKHISFVIFLFFLDSQGLNLARNWTIWYSLIDEWVMFTLVWTMCLLCRPEKVHVYTPECSSMSGLRSRRDPSPEGSSSWSSSAWASHRFNACLVFMSYLKMSVGSLDVVKVQVREKFWRLCGATHGMASAWPSSCVTSSERYHTYFYLSEIIFSVKTMTSRNQSAHLGSSERQSTPGSCQPIWKSRSRCSWRNYPESSACSPQWTDLCGLWFWWLNSPELPGQREGLWPRSPEGRGRCCERSRWPSHQSSPWSLTGWQLQEEA